MDFLNAYYVLACVFGLGFAAISAYGIWVKPDFLRDKSVVPLALASVLLFAATLGSAIVGAAEEGEHNDEPPAQALAE